MDLAEDHLLIRTMNGPPGSNTPLQGAARAHGQVRMAALQLFEHRHRAQFRRRLQHRHHFSVEEFGQRVRPAAAADLLA